MQKKKLLLSIDENFIKKLLLLIVDKILFGSIILAVSLGFNWKIESRIKETEQLRQVLQSASNLNTDLVKMIRNAITESMEKYIKKIKTGKISYDDFKDLKKITKNVDNSIKQIDIIHGKNQEFSKKKDVKELVQVLARCTRALIPKSKKDIKKLNSGEIEEKLEKVKKAYYDFLIAMGKESIYLAKKDYSLVEDYLANSK